LLNKTLSLLESFLHILLLDSIDASMLRQSVPEFYSVKCIHLRLYQFAFKLVKGFQESSKHSVFLLGYPNQL
jgi:hypothetical protein